MNTEKTTPDTFTSPFESGQWQSWTNLDRFNWLRALLKKVREQSETLEKELRIDRAKIDRLAEAVDVMESVCKQELEIMEKRRVYMEAAQELMLDHYLKTAGDRPLSLPTKIPTKPRHKGN